MKINSPNNSMDYKQNIGTKRYNKESGFTSRINIVDSEEFALLIKKSIKVGHDFDPYEITAGKDIYTLGVDICSGGGIISKAKGTLQKQKSINPRPKDIIPKTIKLVSKTKKCTLFHIAPTSDNYDGLNDIGYSKGLFGKNMKEKTGKEISINAFLFGGKKNEYAPDRAGLSFSVFDKIYNFLASQVSDFSYFRGLKRVDGHLHYSANEDVWNICFVGAKAPNTPEELAKLCDDIYISSKDTLSIKNKIVEKTDYPDFFEKEKAA